MQPCLVLGHAAEPSENSTKLLPHLGNLREVAICWSERQNEQIRYRYVEAKWKHYRVRIAPL